LVADLFTQITMTHIEQLYPLDNNSISTHQHILNLMLIQALHKIIIEKKGRV
jgi:hypothetical protein